MKIPVIRQLYQQNTKEELETTVNVLERYTEFRSVSDEELDVIGELLTNLLGSISVHENVQKGITEKDAINSFSQQVLGAIDK